MADEQSSEILFSFTYIGKLLSSFWAAIIAIA